MITKYKKTVSAILFIASSFFSLPVLSLQAQSQTASIVVHALNPEGVEIATIDGVDASAVAIYDGNNFLGYSSHDQQTHNQPIILIPGAHTIRVVFNGMALEKDIFLDPGETEEVFFVFNRAAFDLPSYIYSCALSSSIRGTWDGITFRLDDNKTFAYNQWGTNVHFEDPYDGSGSYSAEAKLQFSLSGTAYSWYNYASYDIAIDFATDRPWGTPYWAASTFADSGNYPIPSQSSDFLNWYLQYNHSGDISFILDGRLLSGSGTLSIDAGRNASLRIVLGEPLFVDGWNTYLEGYKGGTHHWRAFEEGGSGTMEVQMSSVPYDVTGTGIQDTAGIFVLDIVDSTTDKSLYTISEQAKISCGVVDASGVAVSVATVMAEVTKPDGSTETILVSEDQPGHYEGLFTGISLAGTYRVVIKAQKQDYADASFLSLTFTAARNKIPLGQNFSLASPDIEFYSIYIPDRFGGDFTVTAAGGAIGLYHPDPYTPVADAAAEIRYSVPWNQHGWYYVKIIDRGSVSRIASTFVQTGEASYRPWNFWYWPFKKQDNPGKNLYGAGGALEKYDAVFETKAGEFEEKNFGGDQWQGWEGHCWGASVASILLPQPQAATYGGRSFTQEEMEGLVTKLADGRANFDILFGDPPTEHKPAVVVTPRQGPDKMDEFVDEFHRGLAEYLRIAEVKKPLQSNLGPSAGGGLGEISTAIWNHAIYRYESHMYEAEEGDEKIIKISTKIFSNYITVFPSNNTNSRIDTYEYKLRFYRDGIIDERFEKEGQDWISATHFAPYNLWYIKRSSFDGRGESYNPEVKKENIEKLRGSFP